MNPSYRTASAAFAGRAAALLLALALTAGAASAKTRKVDLKTVYMLGMAFSLTDSTAYITDVVPVDSVTLQRKTNFLMDRQLYSFQLMRHLEQTREGSGPYIPCVFYSKKKKTMDRRFLSLHKRYTRRQDMRIVIIDRGEFRFRPEKYIPEEIKNE